LPEARILLVEDEASQRKLLTSILEEEGYHVQAVESAEDALECLAGERVDLVLSDFRLGGMDGSALLARVRADWPDTGFVMVTAHGSISHAIAAVRAGADDYLAKPFESSALLLAVERTLKVRELQSEHRRLVEDLGERNRLVELIGRAPSMQKLFSEVRKVAGKDATVLVTGESGTGKELAARALHALSPRAQGPFVAVNCAAISGSLAEAELFGSVRGAFTGAVRARKGCFQAALGGTLFLDEVGSMPLELQPKFLRALQERSVRPVGGEDEIAVDARIVSATNIDLASELGDGRFREDLYYRLAVVHLHLPPLRERREDVPLLIEHFIDVSARRHGLARPVFSGGLMRRLLDHPWPGNVRELSNTIERLLLLARDGRVTGEDLPLEFDVRPTRGGAFRLPPEGLRWEELELDMFSQALEHARGNRTQAARLLGLPYRTLLYRLERLGLKDQPE